MKRVIGGILLFFGISGVASVLQNWGAADTEYERSALIVEAFVVIALLLWGVQLVRSRPKRDEKHKAEASEAASDQPPSRDVS